MYSVEIDIKDDQKRFTVGDTVSGTAQITLPLSIPLVNIQLSFNCVGEVKWIEYQGTPHNPNYCAFYDQHPYHEDVLLFSKRDVFVIKSITSKTVSIPFQFIIPKDKSLPSSMLSKHGFVKYFVRLTIKQPKSETIKKYTKEEIVQWPIKKNLMVTVGGTAEKCVLLHCGKVSMHCSIGRKGFAPGDTITVHVAVNNRTNAKVTPRLSLTQVQIFMCEQRHKTDESTLSEKQIIGTEIEPHSEAEEVLDVTIPVDASLTIKSLLITVKYFVCVTLDIPHSFDLHVSLPVVVTSKKVIQTIQDARNQPERMSL